MNNTLMKSEYKEFLKSKTKLHIQSGFHVDIESLNPKLFEFQKFCIQKSLKKGKFALFLDTGLGKSFIELEYAKQLHNHTNKNVLIVCPLAVSGQIIDEGVKFGYEVVRVNENKISKDGIYITNFEQLDHIIASDYIGVIIDESSIMKNFEGAIKKQIIELFMNTPYKLACTATPSPNDAMELGNHGEFLNIMSRNEMLSMFFVHDGAETSKWKLKGHAKKHFYSWINNWALCMIKPSDYGFDDTGYNLPNLNLIESKIITPKKDNGMLFNESAINATDFNQELRNTMELRLNKVAEIVNNSDENFIIWVKQNVEADYLKKLIPDSVEVRGSEDPEIKENKLLGFGKNEYRVMITKTKIASFGMNYQNCHNQVFASLDFSFESTYQAIRRSYRFGQKQDVNIHLITTDTMNNTIEIIREKEINFNNMRKELISTITEYSHELKNTSDINEYKTDEFHLMNGDSCQLIKNIPDNSIDFSIFSPPFADLYVYSDKLEDMGNSKNYDEFQDHFSFLIPELYRIIKSGRLVAVHCMDLPIQKGKEGYIGLRDFSGYLIKTFTDNGFIYHSKVTIWKDPVIEMQRTKALGLLHKQLKKDSSMCRVGLPDYLLIFRKDGDNVTQIKNDKIPVDLWQKYASPVWYDINQTRTLQYMSARDTEDQKHICPLQLDTIERAITLWSNENETVFTPFAGIGSEVYQAVKMNRKGIGIELKESYFNQSCKNIDELLKEKKQISLFNVI